MDQLPTNQLRHLSLDLYDCLLNDLNNDTETALLVLDQSKAYDLVNHAILLGKFKILGFNAKAIKTLKTYLDARKQYVQIQDFQSQSLSVGPQSVTQGSTLSCALYLVYILDLPMIFHNQDHTPLEMRTCPSQNLKTFVDDNFMKLKNHQ